jgi:DNA-binding HxlR family transcriptional regulator
MTSICPIEILLAVIGQRWNVYILWTLHRHKTIRFSALKKEMPKISQKVLTAKLRELETMGIVSRHYKQTIPPEVSYSLTPKALDLVPGLELLSDVAFKWQKEGLLP